MSRDRTVTIAAAVALLLAPLGAAWMTRPGTTASPCVPAAGPAMLPEIIESSGLAVSRRNPGVVWSHNDSGSAAVLFALDAATGVVRARVRVPVATRDWEDVSAARCASGDCLYIADIGDNQRRRPQVQIYRLPEPAPDDSATVQPEIFSATYSDGPHNAEAMFVVDADLFIVTRDRTGGLYRATVAPGSRALTFQPVAQLRLEAVTDAETSRDGTSVVVRTSHEAVLYRTADLVRGTVAPYLRIPLDGLREPQGEGVAIDGNMLYLSSEGRGVNRAGRFMSLRCELPGRPD